MKRHRFTLSVTWAIATVLIAAACAGAAPSPSPTPTAAPTPTSAPTAAPTASPTAVPTGPATLDAPDTVAAGTEFEVAWTGPNAQGDYVTLVEVGTTEWTNEPYFYTSTGSSGKIVAPTRAGEYELWYVSGTDDSIAARRPITVSPFVGTLSGPDSVEGGAVFSVEWTGPNGPGDYVTIVTAGATRWTDEDYFYTTEGSRGSLTAPVKAGDYELWYVSGSDAVVQVRRAIVVTAPSVTLEAPASVAVGASFEVAWTGPNGPGDYITIVAQGAAEGEYLSYAYTATGSPVTLTAPDSAGAYEIRYVAGEGSTLGRVPIGVN